MTPAARLTLWFVLLLVLPAAAVAWLGLELLRQDRTIEERQRDERRRVAAESLATTLEQGLAAAERQFLNWPPPAGLAALPDLVVVLLDGSTVAAEPAGRLLFAARQLTALPEPVAEVFEAADALEHRQRDFAAAVRALGPLASSPSDVTRAHALVRLARNLRRVGRREEALAAYAALESLRPVEVAGLPASLVARRARCALLAEAGDPRLRDEAVALRRDLLLPLWTVDRATFETYLAEIERWTGIAEADSDERLPLALAIDWLEQQRRSGGIAPEGRHLWVGGGRTVVISWRTTGRQVVALAAGDAFQRTHWIAPARAQLDARGMTADLLPPAGLLPAHPEPDAQRVIRTAVQSGLPWTIVLAEHGGASDALSTRRRTLLAGLGLLLALVAGGAWFVTRALTRELAVARLQSDFVAAVSHEFRTPLTSLHQFTSLLNEDDDLPPETRKEFYRAQARAGDRLRRLVESLLDFGRMEAGARKYEVLPLDVVAIVRQVVEDFRGLSGASGFLYEVSAPGRAIVLGDRDALARAVSNLIDNAVKYSGSSRRVDVEVSSSASIVQIRVRDQGIGIPPAEQSEIFAKFFRGAESIKRGIRGTGIGLSMVRYVARAHGGTVTVDSEPGRGSTFTLTLPLAAPQPSAISEAANVVMPQSLE